MKTNTIHANSFADPPSQAGTVEAPHTPFLSSMSHELRTPLNGILGSVQLLLQEQTLPSQHEHLKVLKHCSERMLGLINDVLDFSKMEAGQMHLSPAPFDLQKCLQQTEAVFQKQYAERGIELRFAVDAAVNCRFVSDEMRLTQVLSQLLSNALKFTRQGSVCCTVKACGQTESSIEISFAVQDTGIGISKEQQQSIFAAFTQAEAAANRSYEGNGLGLTISKKLVTLLGGRLQVKSQSGQGSTFYFTLVLPFAMEQNPAAQNNENPGGLSSLKGTRVLMADDNFVNRQITKRFLNGWSVEMDEAVDGRQALDLFYKNKYDLLLIDLHMPEMDGYETIAAIRKIDAAVPAFAFTAAVLPEMRQKLVGSGFTDVLSKPLKPEILHQKITAIRECIS